MFNLIRMLYAGQYAYRVILNLGSAHQGLSDGVRFPSFTPLVRVARVHGLKARECAELLRSIARGAGHGESLDIPARDIVTRDIVLNTAMEVMANDNKLWEGHA